MNPKIIMSPELQNTIDELLNRIESLEINNRRLKERVDALASNINTVLEINGLEFPLPPTD